MSWTDTEALVQSLRCYDISLERGTAAIIREDKGLLQPSDWLEFHRIDGTPMGKLLRSEIQVMASLVLDIIFNGPAGISDIHMATEHAGLPSRISGLR